MIVSYYLLLAQQFYILFSSKACLLSKYMHILFVHEVVALCMLSLEILLPSVSLLKRFLYQKEGAKIVPKGTVFKEKVFKWFLLWQAQNPCACSQYIQEYDSACLQHKGKAHFSCTVNLH